MQRRSPKKEVIAEGLPASPGAVSGRIYFTAIARANGEKGHNGKTGDVPRIWPEGSRRGNLTQRRRRLHAAVVARGMGKCCGAGRSQISVDEDEKKVTIDGKV